MMDGRATIEPTIVLTYKGIAYCKKHAIRRDTVATRAQYHLDRATRLLAILDAMEGDPDLEPSLASLERYPSPWGFGPYGSGLSRGPSDDQTAWAVLGSDDDREGDDEREIDICDEPHDDGHNFGQDHEPSLGWTEYLDQEARTITRTDVHLIEDGEYDVQDVPHDGDELEFDYGEYDGDLIIPGGQGL